MMKKKNNKNFIQDIIMIQINKHKKGSDLKLANEATS